MKKFDLILFSTDEDLIPRAVSAGMDAIIVDMEYIGKEDRQWGADTEINHDTLADLARVRSVTSASVLCRINPLGPGTRDEIEGVIAAGANEIFVPMITCPADVETVLKQVNNRVDVSILVETLDAVSCSKELGLLPIKRVYIGLNDLAIQRNTPNIFTSLIDGTVEEIRSYFPMPFGFGGLTLPDKGYPIPCRLLMSEMARMDCSFSFLRRSFWADTAGKNLMVEVPRIREAVLSSVFESYGSSGGSRQEFIDAVNSWKVETPAKN